MEGVDEEGAGGHLHAHDEVPRQPHALDLEPGPARDLHVDGRQRDRDAGLPVEDVAEVAVARVVVLLGVAAEALLLEQVAVEGHDRPLRARLLLEAAAQGDAHLVEADEVGPHVEALVLLRRDEQGRLGEVHLPVRAGEYLFETIPRALWLDKPHLQTNSEGGVYQQAGVV